MTSPRYVLAVVPDLFFAGKISAVANATGVEVAFAPAAEVPARCAAREPALVVLDLHAGPEVNALIRTLKAAEETRGVPLLGFFAHIDLEIRNAAVAAGIDRTIPRSAFVTRLPELLSGQASPAGGA